MTRFALVLAVGVGLLHAGDPASWVPARWEGGPAELVRRGSDKALSDPAVREAIAGWYDPATLDLLDDTPVNCLLLTLSVGANPEVEKRQSELVREYARRAHQRGIAALGVVYPDADEKRAVSAAADAQLDGVVLEGRLPSGKSAGSLIPIAPAKLLRDAAWPVVAIEGVPPGVGKAGGASVASATGGIWIDSNMWLARSFRASHDRPVWISHRPLPGAPGIYTRSIADAEAAGAHWIVTLDDELRARLKQREAGAMGAWRAMMSELAWFEAQTEWRQFAAYGNVGILLDTATHGASDSEEFLNLVARRQIPYRVIYRKELGSAALAGLHALLAFGLDRPADAERKLLTAFAARGGLAMVGPSWGGAPKEQSYTVLAEGEGEIAVYKDNSPDPEGVARDLNDLVPTPQLGVSVFHSPSVLSYVSATADGRRMSIRLVNYATAPSESVLIWVTGQFRSVRMEAPDQPAMELPVRHSGGRIEITVPTVRVFGEVLLQ